MSKLINPKHFNLFKEFIIHLDRKNSHCGYIVTNKGSFSATCFNHNLVPEPGEKTIMDIKFCLERITEQNLAIEIEHFLRLKEDPI